MKKSQHSKSARVNEKRPTLEEIAHEIWNADAILAALASALKGTTFGEAPFKRPAPKALEAVGETLLDVANNLAGEAYTEVSELDESWRAGVVRDTERLEHADALLAALYECLDGCNGSQFDDKKRDPGRVVLSVMRILAAPLASLRRLRDEIAASSEKSTPAPEVH